MVLDFTTGRHYTNSEIASAFGGTQQSYLRYAKGKKIVAICLTPEDNPSAPDEIWVGEGSGPDYIGESAQWFVDECRKNPDKSAPLFIKDREQERTSDRCWEYCGHYRVREDSKDPSLLNTKKRSGKVTRVLFMERAAD